MERNATPGNGEEASNWHTCLAQAEDLTAYWDPGFIEKGTPGGPNLSYLNQPRQSLDFRLNEKKEAVEFTVNQLADYDRLQYEIIYGTRFGERGFKGEIKINNQEEISRGNLILGTCSGVEGKVCVYDQGIVKISLKISLLKESGDEKILEKEIDF